jgi:predicted enzyme related to lactoylglutathione lyase
MGPHQVPGGNWIVHGRDPQGALFALMSMTK